jgi:hypothetical protein
MSSAICLVSRPDCSANLRTSSATTGKAATVLAGSAASIAALSASRLVRSALADGHRRQVTPELARGGGEQRSGFVLMQHARAILVAELDRPSVDDASRQRV